MKATVKPMSYFRIDFDNRNQLLDFMARLNVSKIYPFKSSLRSGAIFYYSGLVKSTETIQLKSIINSIK